MKILIIDNYDSFVYNLVHIIKELGFEPIIKRNDKIELNEVNSFDKILLSPGPGIPEESGQMIDIISKYMYTKSIFGVCLGHQAIAEVCGAELHNLDHVFHGLVTTTTIVEPNYLFKSVPNTLKTCRYHSWVINKKTLPKHLIITSLGENNEIMGIRHKHYDLQGVQFHPESFLTEYGIQIMDNWLHN